MPRGGARAKSGNKPYVPTGHDRAQVRAMTAFGTSPADIAMVLGINLCTLHRKFRRELATASVEANAKVGKSLYQMAIGDEKSPPNVSAAIFWAKTRMGWRETSRVEVTGNDGGPIKLIDVAKLSDEELERIAAGDLAAVAGDGGAGTPAKGKGEK